MTGNFDSAFTELLGNEGGFVDNPNDPGGATRYGITERVARKHGYTGDMRALPLELAKSVAKAEYWDPIKGDQLPAPLDFQVFDAAYNSGVARASEWLQKASVVMRFDAYRLLFLDSLPTWPTFGRGWTRRIAENLLRAATPVDGVDAT